jgi:hypothetical protein
MGSRSAHAVANTGHDGAVDVISDIMIITCRARELFLRHMREDIRDVHGTEKSAWRTSN